MSLPTPTPAFWAADVSMSATAAQARSSETLTNPYLGAPIDLTLFVSCYNEAAYIRDTLETLYAAIDEVGRLSVEVIVIDDCSSDNSVEIVKQFIAEHPERMIILKANKANRGLAQNYLDGAMFGRGLYYRMQCGDNPEPKESLVTIFSAIGTADCIVPVQIAVGRTMYRYALSKLYTFIVNSLSGYKIGYYNGLTVHLRMNVLRWHTNTRGFGFQAEILLLVLDAGFTYREVLVRNVQVRVGRSNALKMRNFLSVAHTILEIANRRVSAAVYGRQRISPAERKIEYREILDKLPQYAERETV